MNQEFSDDSSIDFLLGNESGNRTESINMLPQLFSGLSAETLGDTLDRLPLMICYIDASMKFRYVNRAYRKFSGYKKEELIGRTVAQVFGKENFRKAQSHYLKVFDGKIVQFTRAQSFPKREQCLLDVLYVPRVDGKNTVTGFFAFLREVQTTPQAPAEDLHYRNLHDGLTGLRSRFALFEDIEKSIKTRLPRQSIYLLQINLNRFSTINNTMGHHKGDKVLQILGNRLKKIVDGSGIAYRLGGDEFAVFYDRLPQTVEITAIAQHLAESMGKSIKVGHHQLQISMRIGIAQMSAQIKDSTQLISNSNIALSHANDQQPIYLYYAELRKSLVEEMKLELNLLHAIQNQEIIPWLQPLVDVRTQQVIGYEALARWVKSDGSVVSPASFIPMAEKTGMIMELGDRMLIQSIQALAQRSTQQTQEAYISVNVSPVQLMSSKYVSRLDNILTRMKADRSRILLEVTEEIAAEDNRGMFDVVRQVKELGVRIACDDFGAGYSSLSRLREMPWDYIKIDRSFLSRNEQHGLLAPVTQMVKSLNFPVIIEGVETRENHQMIRELGCEFAQGYLYGKPCPVQSATTR